MRLGLIGLKGHQKVVLNGARELGDWHLVAVSDSDQGKLQDFRRREPLAAEAQTYTDWRHLVEHAAMDVCCVCDENGLRADQLVALAERGVHIVTEKPLTTTHDDLQRVARALAASPSRLTMLLTMRHEPKYATMRELIRSGAIGDVCLATAQKSYRVETRDAWQKSRQRLGGTIAYIGVHAIDMMRWLCGLDYTHLAAFHGNNGTPYLQETEDQASVLLRFANGASATARLDYLRPSEAPTHGDDRIRIAGSKGVIEVMGGQNEITLINERGVQQIAPGPTDNLFVSFANAVASGKPSRIPADDCFYISHLLLHARDAADQLRLVELPKPPWNLAGK